MTLRKKTLMIISLAIISVALILYTASRIIVLDSFISSLLISSVVLGIVILMFMEKVVLSRLTRLSASVSRISTSSNLSARVSVTGKDELSGLAAAINGMLAKLDQSHKNLWESEEKYRTITENARIGIYRNTPGPKGKFIEANPSLIQMFGYNNKEEILNIYVADLYQNPEDRAKFNEEMIKEGIVKSEELRLKKKDGALMWGAVTAIAVYEENGDVKCYDGVIEDITERKRAEDSVRAQRDLGLALSAVHGLDQTLRLCVETAIRLAGMDCGGIYLVNNTSGDLDLTFQQGLLPEFVKSVSHYSADSVNARLIMKGKPVYTQHRELGVLLDETRRHEALRVMAVIPVRYKDQVIACLNIASHTLDEVPDYARTVMETIATQIGNVITRVRAEESLRESEARYRILLEQANDAIHITNGNDEITDVNRRACEMLGYSREELLNMNIPDLQAPEVRGQAGSVVKTEIARYGNTIFEALDIHRDGTRIPVEISVSKITGLKDELFISIVRDITERKWAEEALRKMNEELEQRVETRTTELQNANQALKTSLETLQSTQNQLVQSEKMAALGALVAGVAHEINTPVGVGVTAASHLEQETCTIKKLYHEDQMKRSDLEKYLKTAGESAGMILGNLQRAAELIQSFREVAVDQTSGGKRTFKLRAYIDEILLSLHPKLRKTRHIVSVHCPEDLELNSYPGAFSQIITNFVINSLIHGFEHKVQGKIVLEITREDNILQIRYRDNGKGMSEARRSRIFEPFYTTKRNQGGTGLGLHIVYNLVTQRLNGHIECESIAGEGTNFAIQMPIERENV